MARPVRHRVLPRSGRQQPLPVGEEVRRSNERLAYWTGTDAGEISKRVNDKITGRVTTLDRWLRIADALNMPDDARRAIGIAPRPRQTGAGVEPLSRPAYPVSLSVSEGALLMAAAESARFGEWAESANAGQFSVDQLAAELRTLSLIYLTGSPVPVFLGARAVRDRAEELLRAHSAPGRSRDLYAVAGYACTLLAWISGDLGQLGAADTHGRTAWLCADLADSSELRAWVLSTRSKTAFWDRRLIDAAELARAGQRWADSTSVAVLLAAQEADAAAEMGRPADAQTALVSAADHRDRVTEPDAVGGLLSCGPARLSNYAAGVYLRVDRPADALREAGAALDFFRTGDQRAYGTEMQLHITRALGHLRNGAVDGAADALGPVLTAPPEHRLAPAACRLGDVMTLLDEPRFTGSRETGTMQQAITAFRAESASLALPPAVEEDPG